jgi:nucleotide-binding universal stress UspA family protein
MFRKVVWATDGSAAADLALAHATTLAEDAGGELTILHCEEWMPPGPRSGRHPVHVDEDEVRVEVERQAAAVVEAGVNSTVQVVRTGAGGAAHAIADVARGEGADVIVLGTRGYPALAGLLLGSVTQRLLTHRPVPSPRSASSASPRERLKPDPELGSAPR